MTAELLYTTKLRAQEKSELALRLSSVAWISASR